MLEKYFRLVADKSLKKSAAVQRWNNVPGQIILELTYDRENDTLLDAKKGTELPEDVLKEIFGILQVQKESAAQPLELVVDFESSGYYDPGSMYGGSDRLGWPPEGDDERVVTNVELFAGNKLLSSLSPVSANSIGDSYYEEIDAVELDTEQE